MALLDIIVTHWNEEWCEGRKFFEMLKMQRGVDWNDVRVLLVQDGEEDNTLDMERIIKVYPFVDTVVYIPHTGVSAARNEGLKCADAEWVMFCDFDDMLYSADSLGRIIASLEQAGDAADMVWSSFWMEMETPEGAWCKKLKEWNTVFIHGKVYRRQFLIDHGIWFSEELTYSEDAMFNALVTMEIDAKRIAKMPETVYMWCYRKGSASNYDGGDAARNLSLYRKRVMVCEAYQERGKIYDARAAAARAMLDYYWELNGRDELAGKTKEEWIRRIRTDISDRWPGAFLQISDSDRAELYRVTKDEAEKRRLIRPGMPTAEEWLRQIGVI